jgi:dimethylamine monooxygenase subunit A
MRIVTQKNKTAEPDHIDTDSIQPIKPNFDWRSQPETPYRPWHNGPYHVTMGTFARVEAPLRRSTDSSPGIKTASVEDWIDIDSTYLDKYELKQRLYRQHRDEVLAVLPGCDDASFEALELLKETLIRRYPTMFRLWDNHHLENLVTGDVWDLRRDSPIWEKHHPLEVMGLLATDDFFLLYNDATTGETRLRAGGACFPGISVFNIFACVSNCLLTCKAGFKVEERVGLSLWEIHAGKVPQYEAKLAKSMDRFFMRLKVGSVISRFNYAIDNSSELFLRNPHHNLTPEELAGDPPKLEDLHLRVERQVLQRLPKTRALLFTIRTYVTPITKVTEDKEVARALRTSVGSYTEDLNKYKNKVLWDTTLQEHIASVLGETTGLPAVPVAA